MKYLTVVIVLIGFGFNAISQNFEITPEQLKQIRILVLKQERDSLLLQNCTKIKDSLQMQIKLQEKIAKNKDFQIGNFTAIVESKNEIISEKNNTINFLEKDNKRLKNNNRIITVFAVISEIITVLLFVK